MRTGSAISCNFIVLLQRCYCTSLTYSNSCDPLLNVHLQPSVYFWTNTFQKPTKQSNFVEDAEVANSHGLDLQFCSSFLVNYSIVHNGNLSYRYLGY